MKIAGQNPNTSHRATHYSDKLGERELREMAQDTGRSPDQIRSTIREIEANPQANTAFWERFLKVYPVDWRDKDPSISNFNVYGYTLPVTYPSFVPGVLSDPNNAERLVRSLEENRARFSIPVAAVSEHRRTYEVERNGASRMAKESFTGEVKDQYIRRAEMLHHADTFKDEAHKRNVLEQTAFQSYDADIFSKFCAERDEKTKRLMVALLGDFEGLSFYQMNSKVFTDHILPAFDGLSTSPRNEASARKAQGFSL